jgi:hypothetical protein
VSVQGVGEISNEVAVVGKGWIGTHHLLVDFRTTQHAGVMNRSDLPRIAIGEEQPIVTHSCRHIIDAQLVYECNDI